MPLISVPMIQEKILDLIQEHADNKVYRQKTFTDICRTSPFIPPPRFKYLKIPKYIGDSDPDDKLSIFC